VEHSTELLLHCLHVAALSAFIQTVPDVIQEEGLADVLQLYTGWATVRPSAVTATEPLSMGRCVSDVHDIPQRGLLRVIAPGHLDNGVSETIENRFRVVTASGCGLRLDKLLKLTELTEVLAPGNKGAILRRVIAVPDKPEPRVDVPDLRAVVDVLHDLDHRGGRLVEVGVHRASDIDAEDDIEVADELRPFRQGRHGLEKLCLSLLGKRRPLLLSLLRLLSFLSGRLSSRLDRAGP